MSSQKVIGIIGFNPTDKKIEEKIATQARKASRELGLSRSFKAIIAPTTSAEQIAEAVHASEISYADYLGIPRKISKMAKGLLQNAGRVSDTMLVRDIINHPHFDELAILGHNLQTAISLHDNKDTLFVAPNINALIASILGQNNGVLHMAHRLVPKPGRITVFRATANGLLTPISLA
ncbi:TPA: hypothetical protein DDW69_03085 [candidate division CPR2 bacterium]|uniref:Uncharacterized protein n=1 Tax=candidate division CPR2 bacterium GW2011_GWC1_41_48 TaxID=1618344 RepID=A0A0G0YHW8_UNCC2|nr:MAG: hypothetical protein UT47_C0003G0187 [candidate division CPR2 bacterium GW2011_GWC2_39_35]KKR28599.1 MAG: hypothetical protein UT59_C0023G0005 [candidate division CPR2 bacterium GW2011_GWD1_39_7]KKR29230.1 MAG: hypothetical protein UT60_C0005G0035 [candidate division CPR2 bacterium GW2011_GWD2_39_7]KKS09126.1 MAG: hypothetical protein UU65_C0003G0181 [candidate division CPR2 bacterium GW2011_GWC1_41_48]HBG81802.1 hypothetical protein [candidate division CPR2 bacterium]